MRSTLTMPDGILPMSASQHPDQLHQALDHLTAPLVEVQPELGDEGIAHRELREGEHGRGELAEADDADPELRDGDDPASELADGHDAPGHDGSAVGPV